MILESIVKRQRRQILIQELQRRQASNEFYSRRAFARDLGISSTLFSLILNMKRSVSDELALKIMIISKLPKEEVETLKTGMPVAMPSNYEKIDLDKFALMSSWVHYAILSLLEVKGFRWESAWVAQRLNIKENQACKTMGRLLKLGIIKKNERGRYVQTGAPIIMENKKSSLAAKRFNQDLIKKALRAMTDLPFETRDLSSTTFTLNPEYLPYAVERIRNFRRSLTRELETLGDQTQVYAITVQLFPISENEEAPCSANGLLVPSP